MVEAGEGLKEIGDAFAKADLAGEEDLKGVRRRCFGAGELIEADTVGDDVDLLWSNTHLQERPPGDGRWDGDGVGGGVDLFFADGDVGLAERLGQVPAAVLLGDDFFLVALVGGASVADEDAAVGLDLAAGEQARAGDGDERIAGAMMRLVQRSKARVFQEAIFDDIRGE